MTWKELTVHGLLVAFTIAGAWWYWTSQSTAAPEEHVVRVAESGPLASWRSDTRRVYLAMSPQCPYCLRSMEFYAKLGRVIDSLRAEGQTVSIAAVVDRPIAPSAQQGMLDKHGVKVDTIFSVPLQANLNVPGVPAYYVEPVAPNDKASWYGFQGTHGQGEILASLGAGP